MRHAHRAGLRTTATMMYGTVETDGGAARAPVPAARRCRTRPAASRRSSPGAISREHTELGGTEATGVEYLRTLAHRAARARQLRQPAGVVGHAGRQGRAAEPGVRRQRHGQRDDRGERRPRGRRRVLHGRVRGRAQHRERRASSPSAATCTTTSWAIRSSASATCRACSSSPSRAPTARAGEADDLRGYRGAQRAGAARTRASTAGRASRSMPPCRRAPLGAADRSRRRSTTAGSRSTDGRIVARRRRRRAAGRRRGSRRRRAPARPRQRAHAPRAELDGAAACRRRRRWTSGFAALLRVRARRRRRAASRRSSTRCARAAVGRCARPAPCSSATSRTRSLTPPLLRRSRAGRRRVSRAARLQRRRSRRRRARGAGRVDEPRRDATLGRRHARSAFSVVAHAPYSVSPALFARDRAARRARRRCRVHLGESPEEIEFLRTGTRPVRATARGARRRGRATWPRAGVRTRSSTSTRSAICEPGMLVVHGVHLTDDDLERLRRRAARRS